MESPVSLLPAQKPACLCSSPPKQPFGLTKSEIVQLINHRPPSVVEIFLVSMKAGADLGLG